MDFNYGAIVLEYTFPEFHTLINLINKTQTLHGDSRLHVIVCLGMCGIRKRSIELKLLIIR